MEQRVIEEGMGGRVYHPTPSSKALYSPPVALEALSRAATGTLLTWLLNSAAWFLIGVLLGGFAVTGGVVGGSYYLSASRWPSMWPSTGWSHTVEVSPLVYYYSLWHGYVVLAQLVLGIGLWLVSKLAWRIHSKSREKGRLLCN